MKAGGVGNSAAGLRILITVKRPDLRRLVSANGQDVC